MILKTAVDDFLKRPLVDLNELKDWNPAVIERKINSLEPRPVFVTEPRHHQRVGFYLLSKSPQALLLYAMGLGKTKLILDSFRWYKAAGKLKRLLVCVPNVVNLESWRNELARHAPDMQASYVEGDPSARKEALYEDTDLCITTYAGLNHLVCKTTRGRMKMDDKTTDAVSKLFDGVVWDESTSLMNSNSLSFKVARRLSANWVFRIGLTGTPLGRDPLVLWSQFFLVDRGESLGRTLGLFREAFFVCKENYWGGREYTFKQWLTPTLRRMMGNRSLSYTAAECIDLPKRVSTIVPVVMSDEAWAYYQAVIDQVRDKDDAEFDIENVFIRLRQITSGFIGIDKQPSPLAVNARLEACMDLIYKLSPADKVVVFNEFVYSGELICERLSELRIKHSRLYGKTKDKRAALRRFVDDPDCRVFVVNSRSGAFGLNLQTAHYVIVYESPVSPIVRQQMEARCLRQGQREPVFIYDLVCRGTVDQRILLYLSQGKDLQKALVGQGITALGCRRRL